MKNLVLIGMPGAGKSTAGVVLAKVLGRRFIDTDLVIQERTGRLLQEIIDTDGIAAFKRAEEEAILSLEVRRTVIATGGSVVFSPGAMEHLKKDGMIVYMKIPFAEMEHRLNTITGRGIVLAPGETLREMYDERSPLYEQYADITIDEDGLPFEEVIGRLLQAIRARGPGHSAGDQTGHAPLR